MGLNGRKKRFDDEEQSLSRLIVLSDDISSESIGEIIQRIITINDEDEEMEHDLIGFKRQPIRIVLNSFGGEVYAGLALIDCMDNSETPIHITCYGAAMSMGMIILACGHVRAAGKYSTIMYHDGSYELDGKASTHKQELHEVERINKICDDILLKRTKIPKKILSTHILQRSEWYITPEEALKFKLIDKIV